MISQMFGKMKIFEVMIRCTQNKKLLQSLPRVNQNMAL